MKKAMYVIPLKLFYHLYSSAQIINSMLNPKLHVYLWDLIQPCLKEIKMILDNLYTIL